MVVSRQGRRRQKLDLRRIARKSAGSLFSRLQRAPVRPSPEITYPCPWPCTFRFVNLSRSRAGVGGARRAQATANRTLAQGRPKIKGFLIKARRKALKSRASRASAAAILLRFAGARAVQPE